MILFTHNDLDAAGCEICIRAARAKIDRVFHEDYATFTQTVSEIIAFSTKNNIDNIIVADLSFAEHRDCLQRLVSHFKTVIHIDHHSYPENFCVKHNGNLHQVIDPSRCACRICYDEFKLKNRYIRVLTDVIDKFDRWVENDRLFKFAFDLNAYFWKVGYQEFLYEFTTGFPKTLNNEIKAIREETAKGLQELRAAGRIMKAGKTTIQVGDRYFMQSVIDEYERGQAGYICILNSSLRVRLSQRYFDTETASKLRCSITGNVTGHPHAFSYPFNGSKGSKDKLFEEINRVSGLINTCAENQGK